MITVEQLLEIFPRIEDADFWVEAMEYNLPAHDIIEGPRLWMFLAQCGHESAGFTVFQENLNYSSTGLLKTFPKYFNTKLAAQCARQPELIANIVYANRMGNGPSESGDGYRFRGRGPIQITGRRNYTAMSHDLWGDDRAVEEPEMILSPDNAIASAGWYWDIAKLNQYCDREDVVTVTRRINGGTNGLADRKHLYAQIKEMLNQ